MSYLLIIINLSFPFQVTVQSVENQDDEACLKILIDISEAMPKYLRPQLAETFGLCLKMVGNEELGDSWRHLALELVVTTAETAPAMVRKVREKGLSL